MANVTNLFAPGVWCKHRSGPAAAPALGVSRLPTYRLSTSYLIRAIAAAIGAAAVVGFIWGLVEALIPFVYLNWILGGAAGYACAEAVGLAVNRKRGTLLAVIAAVSFVGSYFVALIVPWGFRFSLFDIIAIFVGIFVAVSRIR